MIELARAGRATRAAGDAMTTFTLQQRVRYEYERPVRNVRQRLVLVPRSRHGHQRRLAWTLHLDGAETATARARRDRFGNHILEVDLPWVEQHVEFVVRSTVEQTPADVEHRERLEHIYRAPGRLTAPDPSISALVSRRRQPSAQEICARVHEALLYEWGVTGVRTTAGEALAGGRGVCQDFAHVMVAACRSCGIPARYVSGHLPGEGGSHAWVEVLEPDHDQGSCTVAAWDPTHNQRVCAGYLTVAVGRDYADVAPISGTYEADGRTRGRLTVNKHLQAA